MSDKTVHVFYACDDNFVKFTMVSMKSLIENTSSNRRYRIHILNTGISENLQEMVMTLETRNVKISFDNVSGYMKSISHKLPIRDYYSKTTYYRLFIAEMYPELTKALYIDSDTIVLGDVAELFDTELGDCYVAAAKEQVMVQTDVFGRYTEEVLGINRNQFFNAGVLVINCQAFRENYILEKFIHLLMEYNFVVTQDEDYLNVICKDMVCWISQVWNTEMFGEIPHEIGESKILHYVMTSKPWHYDDCRCGEFFWEYASLLPVYGELRSILLGYTDEQKRNDLLSGEKLAILAENEIIREDNYLRKIVKANSCVIHKKQPKSNVYCK